MVLFPIAPTVSITSTSQTTYSITVNANTTKGTNNIAKYMYSKDGGTTWAINETTSTTNSYTFNNLYSKTLTILYGLLFVPVPDDSKTLLFSLKVGLIAVEVYINHQ